MHQLLTSRLRSRLRARHLELLDVLGETRNIHQAAPRLYLSQPAVSKLLQEVEELYGVQLFERMPRGLRATEAGEAAIRWSRICLNSVGESIAEAQTIASGAVGRVRVGVLPVAIPQLLTNALAAARRDNSGLVTAVVEGSANFLLPALARGELDVILGRLSTEMGGPSFATEHLYHESVSIVSRRSHPLASKSNLRIADLEGWSWVLPVDVAPVRQQLEAVLAHSNVSKPRPLLETSSLLLTITTLMQSDLLGVLPAGVAALYEKQGLLARLKLELPFEVPPVGIVTLRGAQLGPAVEKFLALVRESSKAQAERDEQSL